MNDRKQSIQWWAHAGRDIERTQAHRMPAAAMLTMDVEPGAMIGEYRVEGVLGEGGMATVYAAVHPVIGKKVAIKVISPALCANPGEIERFVQEARAVNEIGHPNIVDIFSIGALPDRRPYLVMEWLQGESLFHRMERAPLPFAEAIEVLEQLCAAVDAAHTNGIIHRDLKPDNVFLVSVRGARTIVKLLDFGMAKLSAPRDTRVLRTQTGMAMGTPEYVSPEQARGRAVDHRTDIYALGVMAFEMFTGRLPFQADNTVDLLVLHMNERPPRPSTIWPEIPPALDELIVRALAKDAWARPNLAEIQALLVELRDVVPPPPPPQRTPPRLAVARSTELVPVVRSRRREWVLGALLALVLVAIAVTWFTRASSDTSPEVPRSAAPDQVGSPTSSPPASIIRSTIASTASPPLQPEPPATSGVVVLRLDQAPARVVVDGKVVAEAARDGERIVLDDPGEHTIVVTASGRRPFRRTIEVAAGSTVELRVTSVPARRKAQPRSRELDYTINPFEPEL